MFPFTPGGAKDAPRRPRRAQSLQAFLSRLIWVCVLPLVLVSIYLAIDQVRVQIDQRDHEARDQVQQAARLVDRQLREQIATLRMMAASPLLDDPPQWETFYRAAQNFRANFGGDLVVADLSMRMLLNTRLPLGDSLPPLPKPQGHAAVAQVLATGQPAVGDVFLGPIAKEPLVAVAVPVTRRGKIRYLLLSTLATRFIEESLAEHIDPIGYAISLFDGKGEVIGRWGSGNGSGEDSNPGRTHRFLAESKEAPWTVVLEIPAEVYRAPILSMVATLVAGILLVTLISLGAGRFTAWRLGQAVASLAQAEPPQGPAPPVVEIELVRERLVAAAAARQAAEDSRHESDRRFRLLFESAAVPLCFVSADGRLTNFNRRFEQVFGYGPQEIPTLDHWWRLAYPDPEYRRWVIQTWNQAKQRASREEADITPQEYRITCKDGRVRIMIVSGITLGEDLLATFFDITERKQAEAERERLLSQRQLALDAARMGWWHYDPATKIASWDERCRELFQVQGIQGPNDEILKRIHPEDLPRVWAAVLAALDPADRRPYSAEYRINLPDGSQRWIEAHGLASFEGQGVQARAVSLVGTVTDITERKRVELDLRQSQAAMRGLLDSTSDSVVLLDLAHRVQSINEVAAHRLGTSVEAILGRSIFEFLPPEVAANRRQRLETVIASGLPARFMDQRQGLHFDNHLYPVSDDQGRVVGVAIYARDITQAKLDEEKRVALEKQLLQAQKMEAIGTLAGGVAHDFNNILGAITGYTEMALEDARRGAVNPADLEQVLRATERAKSLVGQILTFSRRVEVERQALDLNQEVIQAAQLLEKALPKMIRIVTELAPDLLAISANPNQIEQVLLNLGANAADAMPDGGVLTIATRNVDLRDQPCHACNELLTGPYVELTVSDTGQGMDPATLEHIFEPFFTTKELGQGTGLGLSTVHGIVVGHGGHITCASAPGQGATFTIHFPALARPGADQGPDQSCATPAGGCERLLLVDDEAALLRLGTRLLEREGYQVWSASSGEEAVDAYRTLWPRPELVVMDLGMPGMGGVKALRAILALDPKARVVVASGYAVENQVREALEAGAMAFVAKPYRRQELLAVIRTALDAEERNNARP